MFRGTGLTIVNVVDGLSAFVDRVVLNQTGLTGTFDMELRWTPDVGTPGAASGPQTAVTLPTFFTAVQEQLGLKLERATAPVDILIIDHAEPPTAN
jgi:uncharacterized protein (TIGR03435 family)